MTKPNPIANVKTWIDNAAKTEVSYANAACLATVDKDGRPRSRIILIKEYVDNGFVFYTNTLSRKGQNLADNPVASMCLHFKSTEQQIRIDGTIERVTDDQANAYFASRPRGSQIGAWASRQSQPLKNIDTLRGEVKDVEEQYKNNADIPRPPYWSGYILVPDMIEFWQEGEFRLHTRHLFTFENGEWSEQMLYP